MGLVVAGAGIAVIWLPSVLVYAVGGTLAVLGLFLVASAVLARGSR